MSARICLIDKNKFGQFRLMSLLWMLKAASAIKTFYSNAFWNDFWYTSSKFHVLQVSILEQLSNQFSSQGTRNYSQVGFKNW